MGYTLEVRILTVFFNLGEKKTVNKHLKLRNKKIAFFKELIFMTTKVQKVTLEK